MKENVNEMSAYVALAMLVLGIAAIHMVAWFINL